MKKAGRLAPGFSSLFFGLANRAAGRRDGAGLLVQLCGDALLLGEVSRTVLADIFLGGVARRIDIVVGGNLGVSGPPGNRGPFFFASARDHWTARHSPPMLRPEKP
jgi:hypothetical protein